MKTEKNYLHTVKILKEEILRSRYTIAKMANRELLLLYYRVGYIISEKIKTEKWGSQTIQKLSFDLQNELKGLRGFSYSNLKNMRLFYNEWDMCFNLDDFKNSISQSVSVQLESSKKLISQSVSVQNETGTTFSSQFINYFSCIGFTSHIEIISKTHSIEERIFYISKAAQEFWAVRTLRMHLKNRLFEKSGKLPNNFEVTLPESSREKALAAFRDNYLLDFVRISNADEDDEKVLESEIVRNIKKFLMSLGNDFAFIGNQYRLIVEDEEYYIDLLFFNRRLQALVAFELKSGKFKPEYLGKMNFYLSALDEYIKMEHENPSIGIILCKEKKNKIVEFSFRNFDRAMGVATYKTSSKLPAKYKNILPDEITLKKLMD